MKSCSLEVVAINHKTGQAALSSQVNGKGRSSAELPFHFHLPHASYLLIPLCDTNSSPIIRMRNSVCLFRGNLGKVLQVLFNSLTSP